MVSKNFFIFLFIIVGGASLYLAGDFFHHLHTYFKLSHEVPVEVSDWSIVEKKEGKFSIEALYQFHLEGREIKGRYTFPRPVYPNPYLAEDLMEEWQEKSWTIWCDPKHPHEVALQKIAPLKKGVYLALSLGIILYFAFLYQYAKQMHGQEEGSGKAPAPLS